MKTKTAILSSIFCAGLLLGIAPLAQADTLITFQCDMTYQVQGGTFTNGVDSVYVRGSFSNNFAGPGFLLTNNPAVNTNFYEGTVDDTTDTNGGQLQYKYLINATYETTGNYGNNRVTLLPVTSGSSLVLPYQFFSDAAYTVNPIAPPCVFQVDMAQQINLGTFNPNTMQVGVNGFFNSFTAGANLLTNNPSILRTNQFNLVTSNVYVGSVNLAGSPGEVNEFKYTIQPANKYEAPSALNGLAGNNENRFVFVVSNQVLPVVFFSDQPFAPIGTNQYTFSVDMTAQALIGSLSNNTQVTLQGDFNNWTDQACTNNPNAANTNIYYSTATITNGEGAITQFKFLLSDNYEANPTHTYPGNPSILGGNQNREIIDPASTGTNIILPTVRYSDLSTNTLLPLPTMVTFSVNMTNATGTDLSVFNPNTDNVYLNGMDITISVGYYSFDGWTNSLIVTGAGGYTNALANFLMQNNPVGSEIYTITVPVPSGTIPGGYPLELSYQYTFGVNSGLPIEALGETNHIRYVRSTGGTYVLPEDKFGSMVQEQAFGNLAVGPKSGGNVPITWLGLPGVYLQVETNLTTNAWLELPSTYGKSATNYPVGAGASYFRLIQPF
jgi:hypothetical protein